MMRGEPVSSLSAITTTSTSTNTSNLPQSSPPTSDDISEEYGDSEEFLITLQQLSSVSSMKQPLPQQPEESTETNNPRSLSVQETLVEVREIGSSITRLAKQYLSSGHISEDGVVNLRGQFDALRSQLDSMERMLEKKGDDLLICNIPEMVRARRFRRPKHQPFIEPFGAAAEPPPPPSSQSPVSSPTVPQVSPAPPAPAPAPAPLAMDPSGGAGKRKRPVELRSCTACGTNTSPEWRRGPKGSNTLCNACGLHYAKLLKKGQQPSSSSSENTNPASNPASSPSIPKPTKHTPTSRPPPSSIPAPAPNPDPISSSSWNMRPAPPLRIHPLLVSGISVHDQQPSPSPPPRFYYPNFVSQQILPPLQSPSHFSPVPSTSASSPAPTNTTPQRMALGNLLNPAK